MLDGGKRGGHARCGLELAERCEIFANILGTGRHIEQGICAEGWVQMFLRTMPSCKYNLSSIASVKGLQRIKGAALVWLCCTLSQCSFKQQ